MPRQEVLPSWDHPRLRGKDVHIYIEVKQWSGSPPLTRERRPCRFLTVLYVGITPAYAGKTAIVKHSSSVIGDHPRLRGKDNVVEERIKKQVGSPPLTRERLFIITVYDTYSGITPAYAGKT